MFCTKVDGKNWHSQIHERVYYKQLIVIKVNQKRIGRDPLSLLTLRGGGHSEKMIIVVMIIVD